MGDNGDRDATAPGLQVDEGDTVTITITAHGKTAGTVGVNAPPTGDAAYSGSAISPADVHNGRDASNDHVVGNIGPGTTDTVDLSITADNMAEGDESITFTLDAASIVAIGATPASWTVGTPNSVTFTIRRNDAANNYDPAPAVTPGPAPADNPTARAARVKAPAAAVARGIGQLAADAVARRVGGDGDNAGRVGLWTGGGAISTDGERDGVEYDGDATAWHIGVDRRLGGGRIGISVAQSGADMDFGADNLDADVTSVHPYFARDFGDKRLWLSIGHGSGDAELTEGNAAPIKTDLSVTAAAAGFAASPREGVELAATAVHTRAVLSRHPRSASSGGGARALPKTTADATRLTAAAEFSRELANGARPFLTISARHDSGDDEQGSAGDLGGGVEWHTPAVHFRLEGTAHVGGDGGEEERFGLTLRRAFGPVDLGLNLGADGNGVDTARLLTGEWRF